MAPRPPNYSQERLQRERTKRAKAEEKAQRLAEKTALRKAAKAALSTPSGDNEPEGAG